MTFLKLPHYLLLALAFSSSLGFADTLNEGEVHFTCKTVRPPRDHKLPTEITFRLEGLGQDDPARPIQVSPQIGVTINDQASPLSSLTDQTQAYKNQVRNLELFGKRMTGDGGAFFATLELERASAFHLGTVYIQDGGAGIVDEQIRVRCAPVRWHSRSDRARIIRWFAKLN